MSEGVDPNLVEELRYQLELFIDGSDRRPEFLRGLAQRLLDAVPADDTIDAFLTSAQVYGEPETAFYRTEEEMRQECEALRRYLSGLGPT